MTTGTCRGTGPPRHQARQHPDHREGSRCGARELTDFGIAYPHSMETEARRRSRIRYARVLALEVARGSAPGDASDVSPLGATIYTRWSRASRRSASPIDVPAPLDRAARAQIRPPQMAGPARAHPVGDAHPRTVEVVRRCAQVRDQLAGLVATYNHTTPAQVLEGRIRRADGVVPVWRSRRRGRPRLSTGSHARTSLPAPPRHHVRCRWPIPRAPRCRVRRPGSGVSWHTGRW